MKFIIYFFLVIFFMFSCNSNNSQKYEKKFDNIVEFGEWIKNKKSLSGEIEVSDKIYVIVQAIDGGILSVGSHEIGECYVFDRKEPFDAFDAYVENIDNIFNKESNSEIEIYFNVKCIH